MMKIFSVYISGSPSVSGGVSLCAFGSPVWAKDAMPPVYAL
jgi:hypothetical protein